MAANEHLQSAQFDPGETPQTFDYEASINKGGKLVPVSDQEYTHHRSRMKADRERYGAFSEH